VAVAPSMNRSVAPPALLTVVVLGMALLLAMPSSGAPVVRGGHVPGSPSRRTILTSPRPADPPSQEVARPATADVSVSSWALLPTGPNVPEWRLRTVLGYDPVDGYTVMFGGYDPTHGGGLWLGDTWAYSGGAWTQLFPGVAPGARSSAAMVWDANLSGLLLFGGYAYPSTYYNDTWLFRGGSWTQLSTPVAPSARSEVQMAYDPVAKAAVLFGGWDGSSYLADTWEFANGAWTRLHPSLAPDGRSGGAMAWDNTSREVVLFTGTNSSSVSQLSDTWTFASGTWTERSIANGPPGVFLPGFATLENGSVLLFGGGNTSLGTNLNDTWLYSNGSWYTIPLVRSPPPLGGTAITYDAHDGYMLLFGGRYPSFGADSNASWAFDTLTAGWGTFNASGTVPFALSPGVRLLAGVAPIGYAWQFGDGNTSNGSAPQHTYDRAGVYTLNVSLKDALNLTVSLSASVAVDLAVHLSASPATGEAPLKVFLSANTTGASPPISYSWNFGDGTTGTTGPGVTHLFTSAGSFLVSVSLLDGRGGRGSTSMTVHVAATLAASFAISPAPNPSELAGVSLTFRASPTGGSAPFSYAWSFGDGGTASGSPANHTFAAPGNYTVQLTVTDALGGRANATSYVNVVAAQHTQPANTLGLGVILGVIAAIIVVVAVVAILLVRRGRRGAPPPPSP
jgi:PKD repeat protein